MKMVLLQFKLKYQLMASWTTSRRALMRDSPVKDFICLAEFSIANFEVYINLFSNS